MGHQRRHARRHVEQVADQGRQRQARTNPVKDRQSRGQAPATASSSKPPAPAAGAIRLTATPEIVARDVRYDLVSREKAERGLRRRADDELKVDAEATRSARKATRDGARRTGAFRFRLSRRPSRSGGIGARAATRVALARVSSSARGLLAESSRARSDSPWIGRSMPRSMARCGSSRCRIESVSSIMRSIGWRDGGQLIEAGRAPSGCRRNPPPSNRPGCAAPSRSAARPSRPSP